MENVIVPATAPPQTTLSLDARIFIGKPQIRRTVCAVTPLYIENNTVERVVTVAPSSTVNISDNTAALVVKTNGQLTLTNSTSGLTLLINQMLVLDNPLTGGFTLTNNGTSPVVANVVYAF